MSFMFDILNRAKRDIILASPAEAGEIALDRLAVLLPPCAAKFEIMGKNPISNNTPTGVLFEEARKRLDFKIEGGRCGALWNEIKARVYTSKELYGWE